MATQSIRRAQVVASATGVHPTRALPYPELVSSGPAWDPTIQGARPAPTPLPEPTVAEARSTARRLALAAAMRATGSG